MCIRREEVRKVDASSRGGDPAFQDSFSLIQLSSLPARKDFTGTTSPKLATIIFLVNSSSGEQGFQRLGEWVNIFGLRSAVSAILFLFLAGCVTTSGGSGDIRYLSWSKTTIPGKTIWISFHYEVNPDCTLLAIPTVQVLAGPQHGTTSIRSENIFPDFESSNIRHKCNSTKVGGINVYYTPSAGFRGSDQVTLRSTYKSGNVDEIKIRINVL